MPSASKNLEQERQRKTPRKRIAEDGELEEPRKPGQRIGGNENLEETEKAGDKELEETEKNRQKMEENPEKELKRPLEKEIKELRRTEECES